MALWGCKEQLYILCQQHLKFYFNSLFIATYKSVRASDTPFLISKSLKPLHLAPSHFLGPLEGGQKLSKYLIFRAALSAYFRTLLFDPCKQHNIFNIQIFYGFWYEWKNLLALQANLPICSIVSAGDPTNINV